MEGSEEQEQIPQTQTGEYNSRLAKTDGHHASFRSSDEFFRLVIESLEGYAIFTTDREGVISSWNTGAEKLLDYSEQEIIGKNAAIIFTPEDIERQEPEKELERAARTGRGVDERLHVKKDGTRFWGSGLVFPLFDEQKTILGFTKILRDLSEQKRAQRLIADARVYAEGIVETIREPLVVLQKDLRVISANPAFYHTFHVTKTETEGHYLYELGNGQWDIPELRAQLEEILVRNTTLSNYQIEQDFPIIGRKVMRLNARKLYREANHTEMIVLAIEDITEHMSLERLKDEFLRTISHELKTPVTSVKGFAQLLLRRFTKQGDEQAVRMLTRMDAQLDRLTGLVNDLLDVSRIQVGKLALREDLFDLTELVQEVIEDIQATTSTHHLSLEGQGRPRVYGDRDRIEQVMINFLTNAIKYSPHADKVLVQLSTSKHEVMVSVQDFGMGMADVHQQRVFEQFYQANDLTETTRTGLGMGLYISNEIIKRHHGRMWVKSTKGEGSTFLFTLPLYEKEKL